jgi:hypothetical protein
MYVATPHDALNSTDVITGSGPWRMYSCTVSTLSTECIVRFLITFLTNNSIWRVQMLTSSRERYESIAKEVPQELRQYLIHVTKYQAGKNCKVATNRGLTLKTTWKEPSAA